MITFNDNVCHRPCSASGSGGPDPSVRPNQIFAVSLYHSMLDSDTAARVVELVQRELLTPYGLRTLAPGDPRHVLHYRGDPYARDSAYHQGTVWPWLLGPFVEAYLRVHESSDQAVAQASFLRLPSPKGYKLSVKRVYVRGCGRSATRRLTAVG